MQQKIYLEFEKKAEYFVKEVNRHIYRKSDYIKEEEYLEDWRIEEKRIEKTMYKEIA